MHKVASLNGEFIAAEKAKISAAASAAFYGRGVFTTVAIYGGKPFLWDKHLRRLQRDADKIGLKGVEIGAVGNSLIDVIKHNEVENGRTRITIYDRASSGAWEIGSKSGAAILIVTGGLREAVRHPRLTVSPFPINSRSPLAGVKSCNYLENLMAIEEAQRRGLDEGVRLNERGEVTSGCMANLFWELDGRLFTPSLVTGCLAGTTREFLMESLDCEEVAVGIEALQQVDGVYICSAGLGVSQISSLDERTFEHRDREILHLIPPKHTKTRTSAS